MPVVLVLLLCEVTNEKRELVVKSGEIQSVVVWMCLTPIVKIRQTSFQKRDSNTFSNK